VRALLRAQAVPHEAAAAIFGAVPSASPPAAAADRAREPSGTTADAPRSTVPLAIDSDDDFATLGYGAAAAAAEAEAEAEAEVTRNSTPVQQQIDECLLGANDLAKQGHVMGLLASCTPTELNECLLSDGLVHPRCNTLVATPALQHAHIATPSSQHPSAAALIG
jgi:hypothetical protein